MKKVRHSIHRKILSSLILRGALAAAPLVFPVGLSADLPPVWTFNASDGIHSSPCLGHDGTIYFVTAGNVKPAEVIALTSDANTAKWTSATNFSITRPVESSLVLTRDDATLYVTAADGVFRAVNTTNGTLRWQFPTAGGAPLGAIHTAPAIGVDGTIYYATEVRDILKVFHWYLEALNPDGTEKWEWPTDFGAAPPGRVLSNPAVGADGTLYVATANGSSSGVFAFTDAGTGASQKWTYPTTTIQIGEIHSNLVIDSDGTIYFGTHAGTETNGVPRLWAINPDGTFKWFFPSLGGSLDSSPAFGLDGTIYIGSDEAVATNGSLVLGTVYAVNPADGSQKWSFTNPNQAPPGTESGFASSPAVAADGTIYIGSRDTRVYALTDRGTRATLKWQSTQSGTTPGAGQATGFESSPIITTNGHMVYIGSWDHNLYAFSQTNNGPARSFWPMWGENRRHSANAQDNRWSDNPPPVATILDLGTFDVGSEGSEADAINDRDNVVGDAEGNYFGTMYNNAFYFGVSASPLGLDNLTPSILYGAMTSGLAINFRNVVVGYATGSNGQHAKQWAWSGRAWQQVNLLENASWTASIGEGINAGGNIVGVGKNSSGNWHAVVWTAPVTNAFVDIGTLGGVTSYGYGINSGGWVVGKSLNSSAVYHGFVTPLAKPPIDPTRDDLGTMSRMSSDYSAAFAINGIGQVAGASGSTSAVAHGFLKAPFSGSNSGFQDLGIGGIRWAAINGRGQVVGYNGSAAYIYVPTLGSQMKLLSDYLSFSDQANWTLVTATGISSDGCVVGWGYHNGLPRAFLIAPTSISAASGGGGGGRSSASQPLQ